MSFRGDPQADKIDRVVGELGRLNDLVVGLGSILTAKPDLIFNDSHWKFLGEILDSVEKLRQAQYGGHSKESQASHQQRSRKDIVGFLKWLRENQVADVDQIKIEPSGDAGLGLFAAKDLKKGSVAFNVPPQCILTTYAVWEHPKLKAFFSKPAIASSESLLLMLFLVAEQYNPDSFWHPYISIMPKSYSLPCYWSYADFKFLEGSSLLMSSVWTLLTVIRFYHNVFMSLKELNYPISPFELTWDRFIWAYGTVYTRQNRIPNLRNKQVHAAAQKMTEALITKVTGVDPEKIREAEAAAASGDQKTDDRIETVDDSPLSQQEYVMALIPLFDMCNHKPISDPAQIPRGSSEDFDFNNGGMPVRPIDDTKKGDEINIFYGVRYTSDFVLANGFLPASSSLDSFVLPTKLNERDSLIEVKLNALLSSGYFESMRSLTSPASVPIQLAVHRNRIHPRTAFFFRVLAVQDEKLLKSNKKDRFKSMVDNDTAFDDNETEIRALQLYSLRIQQQLNHIPTERIAEQIKWLGSSASARSAQTPVQKLLICWMQREKSVLDDVLKMLKNKIEKKKKKIAAKTTAAK